MRVIQKTKGLKQILTISQIYQTFINDTIYHTYASFFIKSKKKKSYPYISCIIVVTCHSSERKKNKNNLFEMFSSRSFKTVINCLFNLYSKK